MWSAFQNTEMTFNAEHALRTLSFARVLALSAMWISLCILITVAWIAFQFRALISSSGAGGIGAVSIGINLLLLLIPMGPPFLLIVAWLVARRR
jgi:hypothetical protein